MSFGIKDAIDILVVATLMFYTYRLMKESGTINIFYGVLAFIVAWVVMSEILDMRLIGTIMDMFVNIGGSSTLLMYVMIVAVSVVLSAFIDNIPYVATMLPVVGGIAEILGVEPYLFYYGLLIGATLGGNITPVGASANIAGIGILHKEGYEVKTKDFVRIGVPFTLIAALAGALVIYLIWA